MKSILKICCYLLLAAAACGAGTTIADDNDSRRLIIDRDVDTFAVLPEGVRRPEGITANPANGDIYVGTFDGSNNRLLRFNRHGHLVASRDFGVEALLGLAFDPVQNKVYICNARALVAPGATPAPSKIQRIAAAFTSTTMPEDVATIPLMGAPADLDVGNPDGSKDTIKFGFGGTRAAPNALEFDKLGDLFVSDSFQGIIFRIHNPRGCTAPSCSIDKFVQDGRLATTGFPPFGANGLAFDKYETALFIANTGDDRVLRLDMTSKVITVFAESINGADGIVFDEKGLLWVAANQADEVVALNANGRIVAKLGEFRGIKRNGTPDGLLFPASPVIVGDEIFVTNLAITLGSAADEPEANVTRWTISRMKLPHH